MIARAAISLVLGLFAGVALAAERVPVLYLGLAYDPRHAASQTYAGIELRPAIDPFRGAEVAAKDAEMLERVLDVNVDLTRKEAVDAEGLVQAAQTAAAEGTRLIILDAPAPAVVEVARATRGSGIWLLNATAADDELRGRHCAPHLLHVTPSEAMLQDALAQHLASLGWNRVLLLEGEAPDDAEAADDFERSAERFGLTIVDRRQFTESRNPRQREQNRGGLLTAEGSYDVIVLQDETAELGRHLPYTTSQPRPIVGSHGLTPAAWHWSLARYGASDLSLRFQNHAGRRMSPEDRGAWGAMALITTGIKRARSGDPNQIVKAIRDPRLTFDTYKGLPGSFRPWNNQFREPVLLHTGNAVVAIAPVEEFQHQKNDLDTLGPDSPESACEALPE